MTVLLPLRVHPLPDNTIYVPPGTVATNQESSKERFLETVNFSKNGTVALYFKEQTTEPDIAPNEALFHLHPENYDWEQLCDVLQDKTPLNSIDEFYQYTDGDQLFSYTPQPSEVRTPPRGKPCSPGHAKKLTEGLLWYEAITTPPVSDDLEHIVHANEREDMQEFIGTHVKQSGKYHLRNDPITVSPNYPL